MIYNSTRKIYQTRKKMWNFIEPICAIDVFELMQVLQHETVLLNEKRKCANTCGERRRMGESRQMNVLIIFLDNKPRHAASFDIFAIIISIQRNWQPINVRVSREPRGWTEESTATGVALKSLSHFAFYSFAITFKYFVITRFHCCLKWNKMDYR